MKYECAYAIGEVVSYKMNGDLRYGKIKSVEFNFFSKPKNASRYGAYPLDNTQGEQVWYMLDGDHDGTRIPDRVHEADVVQRYVEAP